MDLPLFPTAEGAACSKSSVVATLVRAAELLQLQAVSPGGSERVSAHSARLTGVQGLAAAGLEIWAIQLLGRWGSDAVLGYIQDVHLSQMPAWASKILGADLKAAETAFV